MQKVEMIISGKRALVDADQVMLHVKKQALLKQAAERLFDKSDEVRREIAGKIVRLNRRIRQNVQFV